ncbi:MAG: kelch repeat-containing protein [Candidatus Acidiferrales bacterium]
MSGRKFTIRNGSLAGAVGFAALTITATLGARSGRGTEVRSLPAQSGGSGATASIPAALGWFEVPDSKLQAACPPNDFHGTKYAFASNCSAVVRAWSGGIADTRRNRMILWGGGHSDYAGNEVYAFDLGALRLTRLNDPSPIAECAQATPDGRANARHTYGALAYIAHADRMFVFGGGSYCPRGNSSSDTWTLNLETLEWKRMDPVHGGSPNGENHGTISAYDPGTKLVYVWDRATGFWSYDYDRNSYKFLSSFTPLGLHANGVVDPKAELFLAFGDGQIWAVPIGPKGRHSPQDKSKAKGCEALARSSSPGLAYDPTLDRIVGWPDFGPTVYLYDPAANSCTAQTFAADAPEDSAHAGSAHTSNGTFGRFQYFPSAGVIVLVNDYNINTHTLRLTPTAAVSAAPLAGSVQ